MRRIEIGLPMDLPEPADLPLIQPVPNTLDYDKWLGYAPVEPYSELRTHPQGKDGEANFGRPGWMVIQAYSMWHDRQLGRIILILLSGRSTWSPRGR